MRILMMSLAFALICMPAFAAGPAATETQPEKAEAKKEEVAKPNIAAQEAPAQADDKKTGANGSEYSCKYYSVNLPDDWKAVLPPTDQQGTINAIFVKKTGSTAVTVSILVGQSGGADAATIATMFAEQLKAAKPPVQKNGQYTFTFKSQDTTAHAYISANDKEFMVTTIMGNNREARDFIKKYVKSENYASLLPQ